MRPEEQAGTLIRFCSVLKLLEIDFETNQIPSDEGLWVFVEILKLHQQAKGNCRCYVDGVKQHKKSKQVLSNRKSQEIL
jgi:hypothetical protein